MHPRAGGDSLQEHEACPQAILICTPGTTGAQKWRKLGTSPRPRSPRGADSAALGPAPGDRQSRQHIQSRLHVSRTGHPVLPAASFPTGGAAQMNGQSTVYHSVNAHQP